MFDFLAINNGIDIEIARLIYLISMVVSLFIYQKRENLPGGIIVPGTLVLLIPYPLKLLIVISSVFIIIVTFRFLEKTVLKGVILTLKQKTLLRVIISTLVSSTATIILSSTYPSYDIAILGIVTPALLATQMEKKNRKDVFVSIVIATTITLLLYVSLKLLVLNLSSDSYISFANNIYSNSFPSDLTSVTILNFLFLIVSIINFLLHYKYKIRSVGMMISTYVGIFLLQPLHLLFILAVVILSSFFIRLIYKHTLIFGYRIFVLSSLIAALIYSVLELAIVIFSDHSFIPFSGLNLAGIILAGILTSELFQYGFKKPLTGLAISSGVVAIIIAFFSIIASLLSISVPVLDLLVP